TYRLSYNATGLPSGTYFYRLQTGEQSQTRKMILMK
ncbi:MAG: T9SS type A sorting domain-containing protein, partial [bacterium]|nr:T9SS type A sorting domain-containing protein [bacterium]